MDPLQPPDVPSQVPPPSGAGPELPRDALLDSLRESEFFFRESQRAAKIGSYKMDIQKGTWLSSEVLDSIFGIGPDYPRTVEGWLEIVHPADKEIMNRHLAEDVIGQRQPFSREYRVIRKSDGEVRWLNGLGEVTFAADGTPLTMIGTIQDVTERRLAEEALAEAHEFNEQIIRSTQEGIIVYGLDLAYQVFNPFMERISGVPAAEVIGRHPWEVFPWLEEAGVLPRLEAALRGESVDAVEFPYRTAAGSGWASDSSSALRNAQGRIIGVIGMVRDITEARRAEEERRTLNAQLQHAQKMESLGSLAGGVAHDLNNVLGAILGMATAHLELQPPDSPAHRAFATITKAAQRGGKTLKSLLNFARQNPAEERELDLNALLREEVHLLERTTLARVRLELELEAGLPAIMGDPGALTHVFMNLCVNAVDAMPEGGTLTLRTRREGAGWVQASVEDSGCGMPPDVLERAMDPFFTTKALGKGTGLGLSMVYSTIKAHQGRMEIRSEPGRGTWVGLWFPVRSGEARTQDVPASLPKAPGRALSVLVVDDDELIRETLQAVLEALGHSPTLAFRGEEALAMLEAGFRPDAVILDVNMPGLGGKGTLPALRALCPGLPVLLATGRADQASLDLAKAHAGVAMLPKPFGKRELQELLVKVTS
ncbi:PAS domain S-box protein [Geothrix sp. 21YS21S-2]|uniref:PAS domain-containing hybrid sensor histidine kinase/response regulator n=1 Tax=Geothrix sp. 21YS21S-2 TaxID=3068893 RepID=UPI0027B969D0|nr:PAS domain S-box protein [Geothrix sp. 21YS21S-2]